MDGVLGERSRFLQKWRPKNDFERWLEEKSQSDQPIQNTEHQPPITGIDKQNPVFHRVIDNTPRKNLHDAHSTRPDATYLQVDRSHGEILRSMKGATTEVLHFPYQLALLLVVIASIQIVKCLRKKRHRLSGSSTSRYR
ncbi:uncharacterized protein ATNIH1004_003672 [Aspergillus tanneri]|uniref:Uncharacterized protein n=1 Tax=Aspergillus tanneri TaxID=1220188 RepID=A0A5M9MV42_9EURO|nr:uncharacterized protein ATNIH1004_003672 [Aspergillus tanneri]KAA8650981.1 hypothetical protein ATNIH1004_003672 [Aspergillus tanneri]